VSRITDMTRLSGEIRVLIHSERVDGPVIAAKLAELAEIGREAVAIRGDIDVTFDAETASYVITLKRPPAGSTNGNLCASLKLLETHEGFTAIPPLHYEVVYALNRLDSILTREERRNGRSRLS
jgi:hypothetical protein